MRTFLLTILIIFSAGCSAKKSAPPTAHQVIRDSVITTVRYLPKDTTYYIPADSLSLSVLLSNLDNEKPVIKKEGKKNISLRRVGDTIKAECHTDAYEAEIKYQNQIIEIYKSRIDQMRQGEVKIETYIPKAVKILMWFGIGFLILIVISIVLTVKSFLK